MKPISLSSIPCESGAKLNAAKPMAATPDMADEVIPPLVSEPCDQDIPASKVYGTETPTPELLKHDLFQLANDWVTRFNQALKSPDVCCKDLFVSHISWRDHLCLSWDFHQFHGLENVSKALKNQQPKFGLKEVTIDTSTVHGVCLQTVHPATSTSPPIEWVQVIFRFKNKYGEGLGLVRLVAVENALKGFTIYTGLENITGNEELLGFRRPLGVNHGQHKDRSSWSDRRKHDFEWGGNKQPLVLIVGGGQGGLNIAARLKCMGIDSLIVEKNPRIGDNWRNRYKFLVLHDPVWYDHLSYINFPDTWPVFTPKDKLGDWFDSYAASMELSYWTNKTVSGADFNDETETWTVKIVDNTTSESTFLQPKYVVLATGHSGEPNVPHFEGEQNFKGKIVHSSRHTTGKQFTGQNAIVLGCCNSGHDIAQDFYEQGAKPIIVQRSSTCIINSETGLKIICEGVYEEGGPPVEIADLMSHSMPIKLLNLMMQQQHRRISMMEKPLHDSLKKAGFKIDAGYGGTGLFGKYYRRGGGYYIDVGCSKLIAERKITMKQGVSIDYFTENGVVFTDGSSVDNLAIVVLATGYSNMKDTALKIFGEKVASKLNPIWGLDEEGEFKTIWRDSGHPNFYYMGGNLALSRFFSKKLALKIIAKERGIDRD